MLASSYRAQEAFRPLSQRWAAGERKDRLELEPNLVLFLGQFPDDDLAQVATVYLAWIAIDRGDLARARELLRGVLRGPVGTTRDLGEIAEGAILRRGGDAAAALERLEPLVGKIIDSFARALFAEEIVEAALEARRWFEAVAYIDSWLGVAQEEDRPAIAARASEALARVPPDVLEAVLGAMRADKERAGYGTELKKAIGARLAAVALERNDPALARRLIESPGGGPAIGELAELASTGGAARVNGRTVGLLLSPGSAAASARSAEALAGVMDGLDLPRPARAEDDRVRLVTRDDDGEVARVETELAELASEGAAVLVAGLDRAGAAAAAKFAGKTRIPVLLLVAPGEKPDGAPATDALLVGGGEERVPVELTRALAARGANVVAPVGSVPADLSIAPKTVLEAAPCGRAPERAGEPRFPLSAWRTAKVDGLLLAGDAACARDAIDEAKGARMTFVAALGLEAAHLASEPPRVRTLVATAGLFPMPRSSVPAAMSTWLSRHGAAPTWYAALAHDAAVLARAALRRLDVDATDDPAEVRKRHAAVAAALREVEGELWSTEARGFGGGVALPREVKVVELDPPTAAR